MKEARVQHLQLIKSKLHALAGISSEDPIAIPEVKNYDFSTPFLQQLVHYNFPAKLEFNVIPREDIEMMCLQYTPFPTTPYYQQLDKLLSSYTASEDKPTEIRIILAGGNEVVHAFVCSYLALMQAKPELFNGIRFKFYVVPLERNHVSSFIARYDSWYK